MTSLLGALVETLVVTPVRGLALVMATGALVVLLHGLLATPAW